MRPGLSVYNMPEALRLDGPLDGTALRLALRALVERHEMLRATFSVVDGEPGQTAADPECTVGGNGYPTHLTLYGAVVEPDLCPLLA